MVIFDSRLSVLVVRICIDLSFLQLFILPLKVNYGILQLNNERFKLSNLLGLLRNYFLLMIDRDLCMLIEILKYLDFLLVSSGLQGFETVAVLDYVH